MVVREARSSAGLTQEALAARAGLHRTYVSLLERGRRSPTIATLDAVARALGLESAEFFRLVAAKLEEQGSAGGSGIFDGQAHGERSSDATKTDPDR